MTAKEAINIILEDGKQYSQALNYALNYCKASIPMAEESHEFKVQCLYIVSNLSSWRHPSAKDVRLALRAK
jgi:hypothetical protein